MKWNKNKSLVLSKVCVAFFAAVLAVVDLLGWRFAERWFPYEYYQIQPVLLLFLIYAYSVPAWAALVGLWKLLTALGRGEVFTSANIRLLRIISWCCFAVAAISLLAVNWTAPVMLVLSAAAALMGLIVRIVKNVFEQASAMKDELDLTV